MLVPKALWDSERAVSAIRDGQPIVLQGCPLVGDVRWDFPGLRDIIDKDFKGDVFESKSRRFLYFDHKRKSETYNFSGRFINNEVA